MNILFVLYHDFTANSATHVGALANKLVGLGHDCCVAVPSNSASVSCLGAARFSYVEFGSALGAGIPFADGRGPDVVHAWTPREIVRQFCESVRSRYSIALFVHLEDNEEHLLSCATGKSTEEISELSHDQLDQLVPSSLSHPVKATEFMRTANGVTVIMDRLREFVPPDKPVIELWPSADETLFQPRPIIKAERRALGIPANSTVLVYTGNVHAANAHEVRSLYLAVAILNREGYPTTLVRAGRDYYPFLGPDSRWGYRNSIELGMKPHSEIPNLLALADILVQPGRADHFNDYRFPSKIPEFLSVGRPVVLPDANIARHMEHGRHAYVLKEASAELLAECVRQVMGDAHLYKRLADGSLEFFKKQLSWDKAAGKLEAFYKNYGQSALTVRAVELDRAFSVHAF